METSVSAQARMLFRLCAINRHLFPEMKTSKYKERKGFEEPNYYVRLNWNLIDSSAFKTLSPTAVWVYVMLLRQFNSRKGGYGHLILPFRDVSWKITFAAFKKSLRELEAGGFTWLVRQGGLKGQLSGFGGPSVYAAGRESKLSEKWRDRSEALFNNPEAGKMIRGRWYPVKLLSESQINASKAREARRRALNEERGIDSFQGPNSLSVSKIDNSKQNTKAKNGHTLDN